MTCLAFVRKEKLLTSATRPRPDFAESQYVVCKQDVCNLEGNTQGMV